MIKKNDMISKFCHYYDGKKQTDLTGDPAAFWNTERVWVELTQNKSSVLGDMLDEYIRAGLRSFEQYDDTPATLKAVLFNAYGKICSDPLQEKAESFKTWYKQNYLH